MIVADTDRRGESRATISGDAIQLSHEFMDIVSMLMTTLSKASLLEIVNEAEVLEEGEEEEV